MSEALPHTVRPPRVPGLTILYHPELERIGERVALLGLAEGQAVQLSRREPSFGAPGEPGRRPLDRPDLSRRPLFLNGKTDGSVELDGTTSRTRVEVDGEPSTDSARLRRRRPSELEVSSLGLKRRLKELGLR